MMPDGMIDDMFAGFFDLRPGQSSGDLTYSLSHLPPAGSVRRLGRTPLGLAQERTNVPTLSNEGGGR